MFDVQRVEIDWAGRPLVLETGRIARQARNQLESQTGKSVVTGANYLPPASPKVSKEVKPAKATKPSPSTQAPQKS